VLTFCVVESYIVVFMVVQCNLVDDEYDAEMLCALLEADDEHLDEGSKNL